MIRSIFILIFFITASGINIHAQIPVILRVTSSAQQDTTGCNIVKVISGLAYDAILKGDAKLWDSPAKDIRILPSSLQLIEQSSSTSFIDQEVIFIYEFWNRTTKDLRSTCTGFMFSGRNAKGEEVAYGYVEYPDLEGTLMRGVIQTNANGNFNANAAAYLNRKNYNFTLLQFAGKVVDNVSESNRIMDEFTSGMKFNAYAFASTEIPQKMVTWIADAEVQTAGDSLYLLLDALELYFSHNEEVFYNLGGEVIGNDRRITRVEVTELWKKINDKVLFDPVAVKIWFGKKFLPEIPYRDMVRLEVHVKDLPWAEFIRAKPFTYLISKVNSQVILPREAVACRKALLSYEWNKITEYIRYY